MSNLLAFNLTGSPVVLTAGNDPVTLTASLTPPAKGEGNDVTTELNSLSGGDYLCKFVSMAEILGSYDTGVL